MTTNLEKLHKVYTDNLHMEDTYFIDLILATKVTTPLDGEPVWLFPIAPSSYGKTEQMRPLIRLGDEGKHDIMVLDQVSSKAFASGHQDKTQDLGAKLDGKKTFIVFPDLASVVASGNQDAEALFAVFRTLYDGSIRRHTGMEDKVYKNCHVNMVAVSTPIIRGNVEFFAAMGTRELLFDVPKVKEPAKMLSKNITNQGREDMYNAMADFLDNFQPVFTKPTDDEQAIIKGVTHRIIAWRAEPNLDKNGYLTKAVEPEYPPRLYRQLEKLWMGLKAIGVDNPENHLRAMSKGCGEPIRSEVLYSLYDMSIEGINFYKKTHKQIASNLNRSPDTVWTTLMVLKDMGLVTHNGEMWNDRESLTWEADQQEVLM